MKHIHSVTKIQPAPAAISDIFDEIISWFEDLLQTIKDIFNPGE